MPPSNLRPPFDQLLATAEAVARERPGVDLHMAREVFHEALESPSGLHEPEAASAADLSAASIFQL